MRLTESDSVHPYLEEGDQVRTGELAKHEALSKALGFIPSVGSLGDISQQLRAPGCQGTMLTMSANNSARTQNVSFSTLSSDLGVPSFTCGAPHIVTAPSLSLTTICPTAMRLNRLRTMPLEKRTKGCQVKEPAYVRRISKG